MFLLVGLSKGEACDGSVRDNLDVCIFDLLLSHRLLVALFVDDFNFGMKSQ